MILSKVGMILSKVGMILSKVGIVLTKERMSLTKERIVLTKERMSPTKERIVLTKERMVPTEERMVPTEERMVLTKEGTVATLVRMIATLVGSPTAGGCTAAERQKICSPRRQPWVESNHEEKTHSVAKPLMKVSPRRGSLRNWTRPHGWRHGLQIFRRLRRLIAAVQLGSSHLVNLAAGHSTGMRSVPGAIATGCQSTRRSRSSDVDPVATPLPLRLSRPPSRAQVRRLVLLTHSWRCGLLVWRRLRRLSPRARRHLHGGHAAHDDSLAARDSLRIHLGLKTVRGFGIIAERNAASRALRFAAGL